MSVPSVGAPASFGAVSTCGDALQLMRRHAAVFAGCVVIFSVLNLAAWFLIRSLFRPTGDPLDSNSVTAQLLDTLVSFVLFVNIWIGASRLAVQNEHPSIARLFIWGKRQWRMLGVSLFSLLIVFAPFLLAMLLIVSLGAKSLGAYLSGVLIVGLLLWLAWGFFAIAKLGFIYPIIANDGPPAAIRQSWNLTRGYASQLLGGILVTILVPVVGVMILLIPIFMLDGVNEDSAYALLAQFMGGAVSGIWMATFASLAYVKLRDSVPVTA